VQGWGLRDGHVERDDRESKWIGWCALGELLQGVENERKGPQWNLGKQDVFKLIDLTGRQPPGARDSDLPARDWDGKGASCADSPGGS